VRFESLRARGLGPFRDEIFVDFTQLPGQIIAISGGNGEGKSTMLELLVGGLTRSTPTRGSLVDLATGRDSFVELRVVNGATHTLRHVIDGTSRKSEALVLDEVGAPELPSTSVKAYDAWARTHLPPLEVLLASTFAAQGSGGFLEMSPGERKRVLAETIGIEGLERLAEHFRAQKGCALKRHDLAVAKLGELGAAVDVEQAERVAAETKLAATDADAEVVRRREQVAAAARFRETEAELREAEAAVADLQLRIRNNEGLLGQAERIRAAGPSIEAIRAELATIAADRSAGAARRAAARERSVSAADRERTARGRVLDLGRRAGAARSAAADRSAVDLAIGNIEPARVAVTRADRDLDAARGALQSARSRSTTIAATIERHAAAAKTADQAAERAARRAAEIAARLDLARVRAETRGEIERAAASLPGEREVLVAVEQRLALLQIELEQAQNTQQWGTEARVEGLRLTCELITAEDAEAPAQIAQTGLDADDVAAKEHAEAPARIAATKKQIAEQVAAIAKARAVIADLEKQASKLAAIEAAEAEIVVLDRDLTAARAEHAAAVAQASGARAAVEAAEGERAALAGDLEDVERAETTAVVSRNAAAERLAQLERVAARAGEIAAAERELASIEADRAAAAAEEEKAGAEAAEAARAAEAEGAALDALLPREEALRAELPQLEKLAVLLPKLDAAEGVLVERREQLAAAQGRADAARSRLAEMSEPVDADVDGAERVARAAHVAAAAAKDALERARATETRRAELEVERATAADEVSDYERLGQDLGANGVQADLLDAAAPTLTEMTNNLLHEAFGPRFTVRFDSTRSSSDGKKQIETLDVTVLDTEANREGKAETFSGGERVILSESISLALTMLAAQRAGFEGPTIVRDESGAALDGENSRRYVAMLRRAGELIGCSKILLVTHSQDVRALCDTTLLVQDGRIEVLS
jgi:DNA repair exonuclease SbcCD ATPase subunit